MKKSSKSSAIKSQSWSIEKLPGLSQKDQILLRENGINTTRKLLEITQTSEEKVILASQLKINVQSVKKWVALADLARVPTVGCEYCGLLLHGGIVSVSQLSQTSVHKLHQQILKLQISTMQRRDLSPALDLVNKWIQQAQFLSLYSRLRKKKEV